LRAWGARRGVPTFLASRRITAAVVVSAAILGVVALPISLFFYSSYWHDTEDRCGKVCCLFGRSTRCRLRRPDSQ